MKRLAALLAALLAWQLALAAGPHREAATDRIDEPQGAFPGAGVDFDLLGTRDSDHFSARHTRAGLLRSHESIYRFSGVHVGADEYRQGEWSRHGASLLGAYRDVDRATAAGLSVVGGFSRTADTTRLVGEFAWNVRLSAATGVELHGNREFIETRVGIESATMSNFLAASVDHTIAERLTLIGLAGAQQFSDDNTRLHLRGRAIYLLSPQQGFGVEVRVRAYESLQPGLAAYFNPEHYARGEMGLRLRRSLGGWRVFAEAGAGREGVDLNFRNPTAYFSARAQRSFANGLTFAVNYAAQRSSEGDGASSIEGKYRWQYLRAFLLVPF